MEGSQLKMTKRHGCFIFFITFKSTFIKEEHLSKADPGIIIAYDDHYDSYGYPIDCRGDMFLF